MGGFLSHLKRENNSEVLNATCGPIRGNIYRHEEKIVDGYLGIPFAKAPVGELRFKKPVAADKWKEPIDCYKYGPGCPQSGVYGATFVPKDCREFYEENCLNLNVFAPRWKFEEFAKGFPVMVYFYGGGFEIGFSSMIDDYSITGTLPLKDVIVVTANYRVGPLGFLTTGDNVAKGNYGLWDQALALKWVQEHIASFGGDPNNVTVFGTSAGGASADLLALSPHSNKLFHRFMAMSGSAYCDFAIRPKDLQAAIFREFAKHQGYSGEDSNSLFQWYHSQDSEKFLDFGNFKRPASGFLSFVPNLDGDFFPKPLDELKKEAPKLDMMATVGEYEGLDFIEYASNHETPEAAFSSFFGSDIVKNTEEVKNKLVDLYFKDVDRNNKETVQKKMVEFVGDSWFNIGAFDTVRSSAKYGNNAYLASFDYYNHDAENFMADQNPFHAASHGSELRYMLGEGMGKFNPIEEELKVMDMIGNLVTNFAKYGNPNGRNGPEVWEKYSLDHPERYFKIDYPKSEMKDHFQNGRMAVYDEINEKSKKYQEIVFGNKL